jgi:hypothetical protein
MRGRWRWRSAGAYGGGGALRGDGEPDQAADGRSLATEQAAKQAAQEQQSPERQRVPGHEPPAVGV